MEAPKSPLQQSEFPPAGFHEGHRDIEVQSPVTGSFLNEKDRKFSSNSSPDTPPLLNNRASHASLGSQSPVRKYSRDWWERSWNVAVAHRVWPRVLYVTVGIVILTAWIGTTVFFATEQVRWDRAGEQQFEETISRNAREKNVIGFISLAGALKTFDPVARNLRVEWSGLFRDNVDSPIVPLANGTWPNVFWPLDIYRDVSTVLYDPTYTPDNSTNTTTVENTLRIYSYRVDNTTAPHIGSIGLHEWDSFETDISFGQAGDVSDVLTQPQFGYPFEKWSGTITFVASFHWPGQDDHIRTNSGNFTGGSVTALAGARLNDNSLNWRFELNFDNPCDMDPESYASYEPYIRKAMGLSPSDPLNVTQFLESPTNLATTNIPCHLKIDIIASRPPLVQFAAVMAVIVNWTSTLFIFILTCEVIIMRRGFMLSGTDLLGVTFTALFALPSVRLLLPGAPEFGALIDLVGIIPNVIIISLCITAISVTKLNRKRHPDHKDD